MLQRSGSKAKSPIKETGNEDKQKSVKDKTVKKTEIVSSAEVKIKKKTPVKITGMKKQLNQQKPKQKGDSGKR